MGGISVAADGGLSLIERAGTIIVPGWRGADSPVPERLIKALRRAHKRGARLLSFCSGVFVLAATGLLDGRRATTHWRYSERLARAYPASGWCRTCSTSTRATCSRRRAAPPASTSACT